MRPKTDFSNINCCKCGKGELTSKTAYRDYTSTKIHTNTSELTAITNDYDFDRVFARQVEGAIWR